jgi:hypothetical protein
MANNPYAGFNNGFGGGFGAPAVSNNHYQTMQVLAKGSGNSSYSIFWDYGNTENFFILNTSSAWSNGFSNGFGPWSGPTLYFVSPAAANAGFAQAGTVTYNPFATNATSPRSNVAQISGDS